MIDVQTIQMHVLKPFERSGVSTESSANMGSRQGKHLRGGRMDEQMEDVRQQLMDGEW